MSDASDYTIHMIGHGHIDPTWLWRWTEGYEEVRATFRSALDLRSPAYGHHDPARFEAGAGWPIMDQGWHRMHFRLIPHSGAWETAGIPRQAWELNMPPRVHIESAHPGALGPRLSLMDTGAGNVLIGVLKQSEEGKDLIVRGYETHGHSATVHLRLPHFGRGYDLEFAPHEIKTLRIDPLTWTIREVNLLEEMDERSHTSSL